MNLYETSPKSDFFLAAEDCRYHFLSLGMSGAGRHGLPDGVLIQTSSERLPPLATCWDAIYDAIASVDWITGVLFTRPQMRDILDRSGLMTQIIEFEEVETQIAGNIANFVSLELIGKRWPTFGDGDSSEFDAAFEEAARAAGYTVISDTTPASQ